MGIYGLPSGQFAPRPLIPPHEELDRALCPSELPCFETQPDFVAKREAFLKAIQPLLDRNAAIPRTSFCTLPSSVVDLPTTPGMVTYTRQYPIPLRQHQFVDAALDEWLKDGTVVPLMTPSSFNIPLILVGKKDDEGKKTDLRPCLDPRKLNLLLPDDNFPLPLIRDIFADLNGSVVFSTIDLRKAYHRFRIRDEDQHKTAFTWRNRQYVFQGAPFGIKTLPSTFQRVMSQLLGDLPFARMFIDDIIVFSRSYEEHVLHVQAVLAKLNDAGLIVNPNKCQFFRTELLLLGFVVGTSGIRADPRKLANVHDWPKPVTKKELQSFLGFANYFREHIPLFAHVSRPLDKLRNHRDLCSVWGPQEQASFEALKALLVSSQVLSFPDFAQPFFVATDASRRGLGAVLYQGEKGSERWISFVARALRPGEEGYSATQKEMAAIIFALERFRCYLWGTHFTLFTDHKALVFLRKQKASMIPMFISWWGTLGEFDFDLVHRPGVENVLPDHLSRIFAKLSPPSERVDHCAPSSASASSGSDGTPVAQVYFLHSDPQTTTRQVVPEADRAAVLQEVHELGHFGANAMVDSIHESNRTWPNLKQDCLDHVSKCTSCQRFNIAKRGYHPLHPIHSQLPGDHMAMDLAGPLVPCERPDGAQPFRYILVLVDVCTRFVYLRPLESKSSEEVALVLYKIFCDVGFPRILQSDNGKEFKNAALRDLAQQLGISHRFITPYHPRANGLAERFVSSALSTVKKMVKGKTAAWADLLPAVQFALNTKVAALHRSTPYSLFFGRKLNSTQYPNIEAGPLSEKELLDRIEHLHQVVFPGIADGARKRQASMVSNFNSKLARIPFPNGSWVMAMDPHPNNKLVPTYEGPFMVVRRTHGGSYVLQDTTGALRPRNYAPSQLKLVQRDSVAEPSYEIESVIDHRFMDDGSVEYLVHWEGYSDDDDEWIPYENFDDVECISDYFRRRGEIPIFHPSAPQAGPVEAAALASTASSSRSSSPGPSSPPGRYYLRPRS
jgi:transposase InsO family protein